MIIEMLSGNGKLEEAISNCKCGRCALLIDAKAIPLGMTVDDVAAEWKGFCERHRA